MLPTLLCLAGCSAAKPRVYGQQAQVQVQSLTKQPVAGAGIFVNGELVQTTNPEGRADLRVQGIAGEKFQLGASCPDGFRLIGEGTQQEVFVTPSLAHASPEFLFRCETTRRKATVNVHTENGANLPIRYLGREVGKTDVRGMGSVVIEASQGETFEVVVDTTSAKALHPQNPALTFTLGDKDESFVFEQKFTVEKPKVVVRKKAAPAVPVRIVSSPND
jgi:hypothetical protein